MTSVLANAGLKDAASVAAAAMFKIVFFIFMVLPLLLLVVGVLPLLNILK
jgi:uncharacterized membrane protein YtjA (UPF0391 family)